MGLLGAGGWAARRKPPQPPPEPATTAEAPAEAAEAAAPPSGPTALFPEGLPLQTPALPEGLSTLSAQGCNACHFAVHDAWRGSRHATAWDDPDYRAAVRDAGDPSACRACHLPLQVQQPVLTERYAEGDLAGAVHAANPAWDATLMAEGVTCAACHVRDGRILGPRAVTGAPHPVEATSILGTSAACAPCHQLTWPGAETPWYDTYGEWAASPYAEAGVGCPACHMPPRAGPVTAGRFAAHADHGISVDPRRALTALLTLEGPEVQRGTPYRIQLVLRNSGAGHFVPTGAPDGRLTVTAGLYGPDDAPLHPPLVHELGRTLAPEPPFRVTADTRLPPLGEVQLQHEATVPTKARAGTARLRVILSAGPGSPPVTLQDVPVQVL